MNIVFQSHFGKEAVFDLGRLTASEPNRKRPHMKLWSDSWANGDRIPERYAAGRPDGKGGATFSDNLNPHLEWSEVPVVTTGNPSAVGIRLLVASGAVQSRNTFAFRTTHDIRDVTMPIVALLWVVSGGVTVDAARMGQH